MFYMFVEPFCHLSKSPFHELEKKAVGMRKKSPIGKKAMGIRKKIPLGKKAVDMRVKNPVVITTNIPAALR